VSNLLYDPIRQKAVAGTPEERVRQSLLHQMIGPLGYPKSLIAVEASIASGRRADIIAYNHSHQPLLLIECKATPMDEEVVFRQAFGYNGSIGAPFWALAHSEGIRLFWMEGSELKSIPFLPPYSQLANRP
jgi:hypothetical protein